MATSAATADHHLPTQILALDVCDEEKLKLVLSCVRKRHWATVLRTSAMAGVMMMGLLFVLVAGILVSSLYPR